VPTQAERSATTTKGLRQAARRLFGRRGFEFVSVDDIAAAAGVTRGAFYHHYDSKEELFEVVFIEIQTMLVDQVRRAAAACSDPLDQLRVGMDTFIEAASQPRNSRIALIDGPAVLGPTRYRELDEAAFLGLVISSVSRLRPATAKLENALVARALAAAMCELATHASRHPADRDTARAVARDMLDALVRRGASGVSGSRRA
jgi:AcrR family transcriptional regulator